MQFGHALISHERVKRLTGRGLAPPAVNPALRVFFPTCDGDVVLQDILHAVGCREKVAQATLDLLALKRDGTGACLQELERLACVSQFSLRGGNGAHASLSSFLGTHTRRRCRDSSSGIIGSVPPLGGCVGSSAPCRSAGGSRWAWSATSGASGSRWTPI